MTFVELPEVVRFWWQVVEQMVAVILTEQERTVDSDRKSDVVDFVETVVLQVVFVKSFERDWKKKVRLSHLWTLLDSLRSHLQWSVRYYASDRSIVPFFLRSALSPVEDVYSLQPDPHLTTLDRDHVAWHPIGEHHEFPSRC